MRTHARFCCLCYRIPIRRNTTMCLAKCGGGLGNGGRCSVIVNSICCCGFDANMGVGALIVLLVLGV